jgi:multimeric flavodoxin WrbA
MGTGSFYAFAAIALSHNFILRPCTQSHGSSNMKILGINGSPKGEKSQTRRLVMAVLEGARKTGADVTFVDICDLEIRYCTACGTCYAKGECIHDDDFPALLEKMLEADGIVLGSPNYINSVTAQLKTMLDRMADSIHCQYFTGKYGCSVSTAGGSFADEVADYMNGALLHLGATTVGRVGVNLMGNPEAILPAEKKAKELGRTLADAIRTGSKDPVQVKLQAEQREYFKRLVTFNKDLWKHEYDHWKTMNWL